ncbi:MAG TPA: YIP1 family protein, partial [Aliiroseovarius sp.]|nr:YIP1 family protein [Aliiroseovarius sp.]
MSAVLDIVATYRAPRAVFRRRAGAAPREDRAIAILLLACGLIFIAQWPRLSRLAFETGAELQPMLGGALFGWMFIAPLAL